MTTNERTYAVSADDGEKLQVFEQGDPQAPIIYLVHGMVTTHNFFQDIAGRLAAHYRVVSYDQRSHGQSGDREAKNNTLAQLGRDFSAVIRHVQGDNPTEKAYMLGHSMGGMTIGSWLDQFPEQQEKYSNGIALCNTALSDVIDNTRVAIIPLPAWEIFRKLAFIVGYIRAHNNWLLRKGALWLAFEVNPSEEELQRLLREAQTIVRKATRKELTDIVHVDLVHVLDTVKVPTTILYADKDKVLLEKLNHIMAEHARSSGNLRKMVRLENCGHACFTEYPDDVYAAVKEAADEAHNSVNATR